MNGLKHAGCRRVAQWVAALALGFWAMAPAHAGAGVVTTVVTALTSNVTYSSAPTDTPQLVTWIGYQVDVANGGGNTINNIRFTGVTSVTDPGETAVFASAEGASCSVTNAPANTAIECVIGQLPAGAAAPTFWVFFRAPPKSASPPVVDQVSFSGITYYAEGTGGVPQSTPQNSTGNWAAGAVTLGTTNPTLVKSSVPKAGGTFFTGAGTAATATDAWTTTVTVPSRAAYTTAVIAEGVLASTCAADLLDCRTTALAIPGAFAQLVIILRRDVSTITKSAKIASARVYYNHDASAPLWGDEVRSCADTSLGPLPQPGIPCIASRQEYTKKTAPNADWVGDWEFVIYALDNGKYSN